MKRFLLLLNCSLSLSLSCHMRWTAVETKNLCCYFIARLQKECWTEVFLVVTCPNLDTRFPFQRENRQKPAFELSLLTHSVIVDKQITKLFLKFNACLDLFSALQQHIDFVCSRLLHTYHDIVFFFVWCACILRGAYLGSFFIRLHQTFTAWFARWCVSLCCAVYKMCECNFVFMLTGSVSLVHPCSNLNTFSPFEMQLAYPNNYPLHDDCKQNVLSIFVVCLVDFY